MRLEEVGLQHMNGFLEMVRDYRENDPENYQKYFGSMPEWDAGAFRAFVERAEEDRLDWRPGPNRVSRTRYLLIDDSGEICGHGVMRFPLDDKHSIEGGNLSFNSPPAKRGGMNEALVLNKMLFEAVRAGMARVLVTCFEDDPVQCTAAEMNRGELEDTVDSISSPGRKLRRYWIKFR